MDYYDVIRLLCDSYKLRILTFALLIPRSASFISVMLNVPLSVSYRCLNELEEQGLLERAGRPLTPEGTRVNLYSSSLKEVGLTLDGSEIVSRVLLKGGREEMNVRADKPYDAGTKD